jgi:hypothetical protein
MPTNVDMELSNWMKFSIDFSLVENCDGIKENCEPLTYELSIAAVSGKLRLLETDEPASELKITGSVSEIN